MSKQNKLVTTVSGKVIPKRETRYIRKKYYEIGNPRVKDSGDCFKLSEDDKYRTLEKGTIAWDYNNGTYAKTSDLIEGYVQPSKKGHFTKNENTIICVEADYSETFAINERVAISNNFAENFQDNRYYSLNKWSKSLLQKIDIPSGDYKNSLPYNCGNMSSAIKKFNNLYVETPNNRMVNSIYNSSKGLYDNYTFGIEFETTAGVLPQSLCDRLGLIPLKDGSISGIEYGTIPLQGRKGLNALYNIFTELDKRTRFDFTCSMHVHIGGLPRTNKKILSLYKLMNVAENDFYSFFPLYKKENMGVKRKHYTAPLNPGLFASFTTNKGKMSDAHIEHDMSQLIQLLSGGDPSYANKPLESITHHPSDPTNSRKWNVGYRYKWFNTIPIIFTNKKTVEYRMFSMPNTQLKMFSFLTMSLAFVQYANDHTDQIIRNEVSGSAITLQILDYYSVQKDIFSYLYKRRGAIKVMERKNYRPLEETTI